MTDREVDAILDQKLFNVQRIFDGKVYLGNEEDNDVCPFYTKSVMASWKVIEKLFEIGYLVTIEQVLHEGFDNNKAYQVTLMAYHINRISESMNRGLVLALAPTAPQAICSVAIKAIELNAVAIAAQQGGT